MTDKELFMEYVKEIKKLADLDRQVKNRIAWVSVSDLFSVKPEMSCVTMDKLKQFFTDNDIDFTCKETEWTLEGSDYDTQVIISAEGINFQNLENRGKSNE